MRVIIAGGRNIHVPHLVADAVEASGIDDFTEVISGGAPGVDYLGEQWAKQHEIDCRIFPARWSIHGRKAGPLRNREMALYADALIAIWDGKSRGTKNMIETAKREGCLVYVHMVTA